MTMHEGHLPRAAETETERSVGLRLRDAAISFFTGDDFRGTLSQILNDDALAMTVELPSNIDSLAVLRDMRRDQGWTEEHWRIDEDGEVDVVTSADFSVLPSQQRFSWSDTLRKPAAQSYALRGLLSALRSDEVLGCFSAVQGNEVRYRTADIARYRPGHYLRRHDDLYDGRVFGFVFFLHDLWPTGAGTRLVAEKPDGRCVVVEPRPGTLAVMRLADGHHHQVEPNFSADWDRYSLAVHFGQEHG